MAMTAAERAVRKVTATRALDDGHYPSMRWCAGPCGRELSITTFPIDGRGYYGWTCKACRRVRRRQLYHSYAPRRRRMRAECRRWYARHAEREREKKRARDQAKRERRAA